MSDVSCPVCKSDSYLNPNIKILISPCFHRLCEQCVFRIFSSGTAPCPQCQTPLRRINFIASTFEDVEVEREIKIRKTLSRHFKRTKEEFNSTEEFNDYLEEYENLVFDILSKNSDLSIKEIICKVRESESILIPQLKPNVVDLEDRKQTQIVLSKITRTPKSNNLQKIVISSCIDIPNNILYDCDAEGLTKRLILNYILFSVFE